MTPEETYEEALRRIREAETTGAVELDLRGLEMLNRLPPELERLGSLEELSLRDFDELQDLSPLGKLTSLRELYLGCIHVGDLAPLAKLDSLQRLKPQRLQNNFRLCPFGLTHAP